MTILNLDGPSGRKSGKSLKVLLGIGGLAAVVAVASTLAANININSGPVEFGQGVSQTAACDDQITVTPYSTFINDSSTGSHRLTSIKIGGIDSSEDKCAGKTFVVKAYGDSGLLDLFNWEANVYDSLSEELNWTETERYNFVEIRNDVNEFIWTSGGTDDDDVFSETSTVTDTSFTLNLVSGTTQIRRNPLALASDVERITVETRDTVYSVGDIGPGNGIVFYYSQTGFRCGPTLSSICRNLEAAQSNWTLGGDPGVSWSTDTDSEEGRGNQVISVQGAYGTAIGTGYKNSIAIVEQAGNVAASTAAVAARDYRGPKNLTDWYLPSQDELSQIYSKKAVVGVFEEAFYWSSTERYADFGWAQIMSNGFGLEYQKRFDYAVRPIRAF